MSRTAFGKKDEQRNQPQVDRFVTSRSSLDDMRMRRYLKNDCSYIYNMSDMDLIRTPNHFYKKTYKRYLDNAFGLNDMKRTRFSLKNTCFPPQPDMFTDNPDFTLQAWPCVPRKKQYLNAAGSVLDLPTFSYSPFKELLDWSKRDVLIAALGRTYYTWSWQKQNLESRGYTDFGVHACKFEPTTGEKVAFGTVAGVEIHDGTLCKLLTSHSCQCNSLKSTADSNTCNITCLDWSPTGNSYVTGCSRGVVTAWSINGSAIAQEAVHMRPVLNVCISPDTRYLASNSLDRNVIKILVWPTLQAFYHLRAEWNVRTLNWHPWRSSLLCIGAMSVLNRATLAFWSAAADRINAYTITMGPCFIDTALISNVTGEIVISVLPDLPLTHAMTTALLVLSDPYTVVDMWDYPESGYIERITKMMFSPDGTKLATATTDEDLLIWNFLPETKKHRGTRRFSALPVYLDQAENGCTYR